MRVLILLLVALPSLAQAQTRSGIDWSLFKPNAGPDAAETIRLNEASRQARLQEQQQQAALAQQQEQSSDNALREARRRAVGEMIADGQCEQARNMALKAGDFALVAEIKPLCP